VTLEPELASLEAELGRARPARPPAEFLQRLASEVPGQVLERRTRCRCEAQGHTPHPTSDSNRSTLAVPRSPTAWLPLLLRWLVPATAAVALCLVVWQANHPNTPGRGTALTRLKADDVEIDQQLVSTFDTVAPLESGEPVRFRCRQWVDEMVLRDSKQGVEVTRRVPRLEVVPVRFETY
jgi:hypothetical protein